VYMFMFNGPLSLTESTLHVLCPSGKIVGVVLAVEGRIYVVTKRLVSVVELVTDLTYQGRMCTSEM
jgi:hypothetical protein